MSLSPEQFAYLWFGSLLVLWVGYLVYLATRRPYSIWENILFSPIYTVCRLLWRVELMTPFPLDAKQGALMIANHRCSLDPFFLQMLPQRRVHWMVAKEYCEHPVMGVALKLFQAIPTNRGGMDTGSTKLAIRYAEKGDLVGMFPEGRINRSPNLFLSVRPGAAKVALRANVPIVPCYIEGAPRTWFVLAALFKAAHVRVYCGTPIYPADVVQGDEPTKEDELQFIYRGLKQVAVLAGQPDFEVEVASKNWVKS